MQWNSMKQSVLNGNWNGSQVRSTTQGVSGYGLVLRTAQQKQTSGIGPTHVQLFLNHVEPKVKCG
ncbi:hypothetical protein BDW59DRAFT_151675 [Aspergillus cavernicola]|uniref:Uncharacterized protein n=1 Tax=Aspergillus cavernicola TaxID=176166 RepID=A0ABR4HUA0_9EURO